MIRTVQFQIMIDHIHASQNYSVNGFRAFCKQAGMTADLDDKEAFTDPAKCSSPITTKEQFWGHIR